MRYDHPSEFSGNSMSLASVDDGSLDVTVLQPELVFQDEPKNHNRIQAEHVAVQRSTEAIQRTFQKIFRNSMKFLVPSRRKKSGPSQAPSYGVSLSSTAPGDLDLGDPPVEFDMLLLKEE